jgi:hypothetical protein
MTVSTPTPAHPHANGFLTVMEAIGRDCLKALSYMQLYLPAATALAGLIFPPAQAELGTAANVIALIENAVATVEAKWAAGGQAAQTGPQKLADVLTLTEATVVQLLSQLGIHADAAYVTNLVNVIVGILNLAQVSSVNAAAAA